MLIKGALAGGAIVAFSACAFAADITYYPPPSESPLYSPTPIVTGDISLALGAWWLSGKSDSGGFFNLDGRLNVPLRNDWNIMPEVFLSHEFDDGTLYSGILHLYKNLPNAAIGPFAAVTGVSGWSATAFTIGVEGRTRNLGNNVALTGQASYTAVDSSGFAQFGGFLDYYISPECKFTAGLQVAANSDDTVFEGSARLTKHIPNTRFNVFAGASVYTNSLTAFSAEVGATLNLAPTIETIVEQDNNRPFHFTPIGLSVSD